MAPFSVTSVRVPFMKSVRGLYMVSILVNCFFLGLAELDVSLLEGHAPGHPQMQAHAEECDNECNTYLQAK